MPSVRRRKWNWVNVAEDFYGCITIPHKWWVHFIVHLSKLVTGIISDLIPNVNCEVRWWYVNIDSSVLANISLYLGISIVRIDYLHIQRELFRNLFSTKIYYESKNMLEKSLLTKNTSRGAKQEIWAGRKENKFNKFGEKSMQIFPNQYCILK